MRAGATTLTLLSTPRNFLILQALEGGPKSQLDLRRAAGSPAQSTMRSQLIALEEALAITRQRREASSSTLVYGLTKQGRELLVVAAHLGRWLAKAPSGVLPLGSDPARAAVKGLVDGWEAKILAHLAEGPFSLTQLDRRLPEVSYPTIERRIATMRLADQIETGPRTGNGTPYTISPWVRLGIGPLTAAIRWEYLNPVQGSDPLSSSEIAAAFRIAAPLLTLDESFSGICQLAVRAPTPQQKRRRFLGTAKVSEGAASFGEVYPQTKPDAWASGMPEDWFSAILEGDRSSLRKSGNRELLDALLIRIHGALFAAPEDTRVTAGADS